MMRRLLCDLLLPTMLVGISAVIDAQEKIAPAELGPTTRVLTGQVTNEEGEPIRGASVEWGYFSAGRDSREVVRTNQDGTYRLETTEVGPDFRLGVAALGYAPQWRDGVIPALASSATKSNFNFKLGKPITLNGVVVDRAGKPIQGVRVIARSPTSGFHSSFSMPTPSFPFPGPEREGTTDAQGRFSIRYLPPTSVQTKEADQGHPFDMRIETNTGLMIMGKAYSEIENQLQINRAYVSGDEGRDGKIRAIVRDAETKEPIRNFKVVMRHRPTMQSFETDFGEFVLEGLTENQPRQFFVYANGYAPFVARPYVTSGKGAFVECMLERHQGIQGKLIDSSGQPLQNAVVLAGVRKDNDNRFEWGSFDKLVDGHMSLTFVQRMTTGSDGGFEFSIGSTRPVLAILAPGQARRLVTPTEWDELSGEEGSLTIPLRPECVIHGQVIKNGKPESNAVVSIDKTGDWSLNFGHATADEDGYFRIENLAPGMYRVSAYQSTRSSSSSRISRVFELGAGESRQCNLDNPGGNSSLSGKAPPFSIISVQRKELKKADSDVSQVGTIASAEGEYRVEGLHAGTYTVSVTQVSSLAGYRQPPQREELQIEGATTKDFAGALPIFQMFQAD